MFRRVAIIGGGAAAASLLGELLERRPPHPLHLDWYTGGIGTPVRGVAYGTPSERHLLNVRAASMGMFGHRPQGFLEYAQRLDPAVRGTDFLPRRRYGDYLEAEVARLLAHGRTLGHDVNIIPFQADALVPENDGVTVVQNETSRRVDAAVLALGALPPRPLAGVDATLLDDGRYVVDPWQLLKDLSRFDPAPRRVMVIGLGLTAADVLLELAAQWPQTQFTAVSRHGLLPEPHLRKAAVPSDDSAELIAAMHDTPEIRQWLHLLREAGTQESDWRVVVDSLRPHASGLWQALSPEQRARFLRHARWAWERVRHRMPPAVHAGLAELERSGRLQRRCGRMRSAAPADGGVRVQIGHADAISMIEADLVIQTVGLDTDVRRTDHRLIGQLLTNAHILPDPLGLGVQAEPDGRLQHPAGSWPSLFAIGSLLRGTLWESTAMPEIRQQARQLADRLLAD